jgi:hypothetical protein
LDNSPVPPARGWEFEPEAFEMGRSYFFPALLPEPVIPEEYSKTGYNSRRDFIAPKPPDVTIGFDGD